MLTRWSRTLIPTLRQPPAEAEAPSHRLMLAAGYLHKLAAGVYDYLPLGWRTLRKASAIVREEMDAADAVEVLLPALQPIELWERTGRRADYGENLFVVEDRHGRALALGPTHEEVVTTMLGAHVKSYRDLPKTLYQIQTKFRDEFRPRFGVLRSREFQMKDAYSFDLDLAGLDRSYQAMYDAYTRIFQRCGLPYQVVEAESGPIGGSASHEFMVPSPTGEDVILKSDGGDYAANVEKCGIGKRQVSETFRAMSEHAMSDKARQWRAPGFTPASPPTGDLDKVHTPDCAGIEEVILFFKKKLGTKLKPKNMLKTLVCQADEGRWAIAVVRGDHDLNEGKLRAVSDSPTHLAEDGEAREAGFAIGFVGPQIAAERDDVTLYVDPDAAQDQFWVTGANEADHHVRHFNWKRDVFDKLSQAGPEESARKVRMTKGRIRVADIRNAVEGDPSPRDDGGVLRETRGIEIGHVFKLGSKYSDALGVKVLDEHNQRVPVLMGCYGIGVNRILAAAIEVAGGGSAPDADADTTRRPSAGHDDHGIIWPRALAPYDVLITPIKYEGRVREVVDRLANEIEGAIGEHGLPTMDVLVDDRDERPGVKFKDADLIGIPLRITVGEKGLATGSVEMKLRNGANGPKGEQVPVDHAADRAADLLTRA